MFSTILLCYRDEEFTVKGVLQSDVIHANSRELPSIFKVGLRSFVGEDFASYLLKMFVTSSIIGLSFTETSKYLNEVDPC